MFPPATDHNQGDHSSINEYTTQNTIKFLKLYQYTVASLGILNSEKIYKLWNTDNPI
jgi:hypothetical protein